MGGTTRFVASAAMLLLLTLHAIVLVGATNTGVTNIQPTHETIPQAHPSSTADALNAVNSGGMMHYYMDTGGSLTVSCEDCLGSETSPGQASAEDIKGKRPMTAEQLAAEQLKSELVALVHVLQAQVGGMLPNDTAQQMAMHLYMSNANMPNPEYLALDEQREVLRGGAERVGTGGNSAPTTSGASGSGVRSSHVAATSITPPPSRATSTAGSPSRGAPAAGAPVAGCRRWRLASAWTGCAGAAEGFRWAEMDLVWACEVDETLRSFLKAKYNLIPFGNITDAELRLPIDIDCFEGGFPCTGLSDEGLQKGDGEGTATGTWRHGLGLLEKAKDEGHPVEWVCLENVLPVKHKLDFSEDKTPVIDKICRRLADIGYRWCYREVDLCDMGLCQTRKRVIIVASFTRDPRPVLLGTQGASCVVPTGAPNGSVGSCVGLVGGRCWRCSETDVAGSDTYCFATSNHRGYGLGQGVCPTFTTSSKPCVVLPNGLIGEMPLEMMEEIAGLTKGWTAEVDGEGNAYLTDTYRRMVIGNCCAPSITCAVGKNMMNIENMEPYDGAADPELDEAQPRPPAAWGGKDGDEYYSHTVSRTLPPLALTRFKPLQEVCNGQLGGKLSSKTIDNWCTRAIRKHRAVLPPQLAKHLHGAGFFKAYTRPEGYDSLPSGLMHAGRRVWARSLLEDDDGALCELWWPGVVLSQDMLAHDAHDIHLPRIPIRPMHMDTVWEKSPDDVRLYEAFKPTPCVNVDMQRRRDDVVASLDAEDAP